MAVNCWGQYKGQLAGPAMEMGLAALMGHELGFTLRHGPLFKWVADGSSRVVLYSTQTESIDSLNMIKMDI